MRWTCLPLLTVISGCGVIDGAVKTREHHDPSGFSIAVPETWQVQRFERGEVRASSADQSQFIYVIPILGRTLDCQTLLRRNLEGGWNVFPAVSNLVIEPASPGSAVARFQFRQSAAQGAALCAETGRRTGMVYAMGAPSSQFASAQPVMAAALRSFKYGPPKSAGGAAAPRQAALPPMTKWREPNEGAWVMQMPEGWQAQGGVLRISNMDVRGGVRIWSPDGQSMIQFNDTRLDKCIVPGPQSMTNVHPGQGLQWCPYQTGLQVAEWYVNQILARDLGLDSLQIVNRQDRPDLSQPENMRTAAAGLGNFQHSHGEVEFRANRQGRPVEGRFLGVTQMFWSPDRNLLGGNYTMIVNGSLGPVGSLAQLTRIAGHIHSNWEHNVQWIMANRRASARDAQLILDYLRESGEAQQKAFWERMDASGRRAEAVGDTLLGRVRLTDGQGNQYEAKAGSNYYFFDEQAGRTALRPNDAVTGADIYPSPSVDLRPLEVIR